MDSNGRPRSALWETGRKPPPRAIVLLLHLSGGQLGVLDPAWQDWCLRAGQLWAPQLPGQGHLKVYEYVFQERDALRREKANGFGRGGAGTPPGVRLDTSAADGCSRR